MTTTTCDADGIRLTASPDDLAGLDPNHTYFVEQSAAVELTAEFDFEGGESAKFALHDFTQGGEDYEMHIDRIEYDSSGNPTVVEQWTRNGTKAVSGVYSTEMTLYLDVDAQNTTNSSNSLSNLCTIHVRAKGRPGGFGA